MVGKARCSNQQQHRECQGLCCCWHEHPPQLGASLQAVRHRQSMDWRCFEQKIPDCKDYLRTLGVSYPQHWLLRRDQPSQYCRTMVAARWEEQCFHAGLVPRGVPTVIFQSRYSRRTCSD